MRNRDPVMIDLDKYLLTQEEDYIDPHERAQEILERAADDACSTFKEDDDES
jgi:PHD/YefM family antitoxin component YafN of YafNO toxin-antitoxin module